MQATKGYPCQLEDCTLSTCFTCTSLKPNTLMWPADQEVEEGERKKKICKAIRGKGKRQQIVFRPRSPSLGIHTPCIFICNCFYLERGILWALSAYLPPLRMFHVSLPPWKLTIVQIQEFGTRKACLIKMLSGLAWVHPKPMIWPPGTKAKCKLSMSFGGCYVALSVTISPVKKHAFVAINVSNLKHAFPSVCLTKVRFVMFAPFVNLFWAWRDLEMILRLTVTWLANAHFKQISWYYASVKFPTFNTFWVDGCKQASAYVLWALEFAEQSEWTT